MLRRTYDEYHQIPRNGKVWQNVADDIISVLEASLGTQVEMLSCPSGIQVLGSRI